MIRYPAPLRPGDRIGVTSPSAGVADALRPRLDHAVRTLRDLGYDVVVGRCMAGDGVVSAPACERASELMAMLLDPAVRAVVPPWGGELAIDLLPHLDWDAVAAAEPTWLVGYSDISTLLAAMTLRTGIATLHGPNLMDTPYAVPEPLLAWHAVASAAPGAPLRQGPAARYRSTGWDDYVRTPQVDEYHLDAPGGWRLLDGTAGDVLLRGRLIGGCLETVANLSGTPYGPAAEFAGRHAPEGTVVYLEVAEADAFEAARRLHGMRLAGWFDAATGVLVGRTAAPDSPGLTQQDAVRDALGTLGVPVVLDVDCGHVPPQLALVNGARTVVARTAGRWTLEQVMD
ncbi:S66 peptidase family protein [uncultured Cellulomonas sp.]|uniref:S66 family peptidase n=1 Tax=uncultured Cellulomonas sp. TaxID=189682 RepID=UPI00261B1FEE|nr:S66 peptidase family protein [uncultured Cellulomonas sp.]